MIKLPPNSQWTQNPSSDVFGSLHSSFNLDLTNNKGHTKISPRGVITTDDITNLGIGVGFVRFNNSTNGNGFYTVAGDRMFVTSSADPSVAFAAASDTSTAHSSDTADIMFFRKANKLVTTVQTSIALLSNSGGHTVTGGGLLTSGTVHMMCQYASKGYVTDAVKTIGFFDTSGNLTASGANTFTISTYSSSNVGLFIIDILEMTDGILILTSTQQQGEYARIIKWDGATTDDPDAEYLLDTQGVMAGIIIGGTPYILTAEAELQVFNGGAFVRVPNGGLPVNQAKYLKNSFSTLNNRWIHPNGMVVTDEGKINILINNEYEDGSIEENMPSGIWEFDLNETSLGWYHKHSLSLYTSTVTDFGQNRVSRVGGISYVKTPNKDGTFLVGAQIYSDETNTKEVIETNNTDDDIQKYGYLVTKKIYSQNIQDSWARLYARFKKFLTSTDKIWVKYRNDDPDPTNITLTWLTTSKFTTSTNLTAMTGYEVEILQGIGSGFCSHISLVEDVGGNYEVTLDETYTGATGTAKARVQNWTKAGVPFSNQIDKWNKWDLGGADTWVQIKVCMLFTGKNELDDLVLINNTHTKAE